MLGLSSRTGAIVVVAIMAVGLSACGSSGTTTISTPSGSATIKSSSNGNNSSVKVKTNKGTAEINSGSALPSGFPTAVPLPTFLKLSTSVGASTHSGSSFELIYNVTGGLAQAVDRYDARLRAAGFVPKLTGSINGVIEQVWKTSAWTVEVNADPSSGGGQPAEIALTVVPTTSSS